MLALARKTDALIEPLRKLADCAGSPLYDLAARLYLAWVFWRSGMTRYHDFASGTFDNQIFLFEMEHPVPYLAPETAAYVTMGAELLFPVMLVPGLFSRLAAGGVLVMTAIIEFTYIHAIDHILWAFLAGTILIKGPGILSLDALLVRVLRQTRPEIKKADEQE